MINSLNRLLRALQLSARRFSTLNMSSSQAQKSKLLVNIDVTSDIVCPWCWVGKRHLDAATAHVKDDFDFRIRWKPFLLNPSVPEQGIPILDYLKVKFGPEAAERFLSGTSPLVQQGKSVGINFNSTRLVIPTKRAHILLDYAATQGKQHELQEVLFRAYFADGRNVNSEDVLAELLGEAGLDATKGLAMIKDTKAEQEFEEGIEEAMDKGVSGVPFFEIYLPDNPKVRQSFSGAQPVETFISIFNKLKILSSKV